MTKNRGVRAERQAKKLADPAYAAQSARNAERLAALPKLAGIANEKAMKRMDVVENRLKEANLNALGVGDDDYLVINPEPQYHLSQLCLKVFRLKVKDEYGFHSQRVACPDEMKIKTYNNRNRTQQFFFIVGKTAKGLKAGLANVKQAIQNFQDGNNPEGQAGEHMQIQPQEHLQVAYLASGSGHVGDEEDTEDEDEENGGAAAGAKVGGHVFDYQHQGYQPMQGAGEGYRHKDGGGREGEVWGPGGALREGEVDAAAAAPEKKPKAERRRKRRWSADEERILCEAVQRHGSAKACFSDMLKDPECAVLKDREFNNTDLKDKYRTLVKAGKAPKREHGDGSSFTTAGGSSPSYLSSSAHAGKRRANDDDDDDDEEEDDEGWSSRQAAKAPSATYPDL